MGGLHIQHEWQVGLPQPHSPLSHFAADVSATQVAKNSSCGSGILCPLQQPHAFDWVPSVAVLSDAGLEVGGVVVSLLDIISVRLIPEASQYSANEDCSSESPADLCGGSEEAGVSNKGELPSNDQTSAGAAVDGCDGISMGHSSGSESGAEKENVDWLGEAAQSGQVCKLVVLLRSPLPTAEPDPPLYPVPAGLEPEAGSCIVMSTTAASAAASLSSLEEAVAYAPLSVYVHLEAATALLPQLPVEPSLYPTWRRIMLQQRRLQIQQRQPSLQVAASAAGCRGTRCNKSAAASAAFPAGAAAAALIPFELQGGGCRLAKGSTSCCEDAFFYLEHEGCFGVFDGVGSWAVEGIDASRFSEGLAAAAAAEAAAHLHPERMSPQYLSLDANGRARLLLQRAHEAVCSSADNRWGSSTAAVGCIDRRTGKLGVACLGDSVLMVLRRQMMPCSMSFYASEAPSIKPEALLLSATGGMVGSAGSGSSRFPRLLRRCCWRTKEQRWENGAPYQLCNLPPKEEWETLRQQGCDRFVSVLERIDPQGDTADIAYAPPQPLLLQPGDLLLIFSDGVADNLFDREIEVFSSLAISPEEAALLQQQQQQQQQGKEGVQKHKQQLSQEEGQQKKTLIGFTPAQDIAELIVKIAKRKSQDGLYERPFVAAPEGTRALPAHLAGGEGEGPRGGKRDDISCVALWVTAAAPCTLPLAETKARTPAVPAAGPTAAAAAETLPTESATSKEEVIQTRSEAHEPGIATSSSVVAPSAPAAASTPSDPGDVAAARAAAPSESSQKLLCELRTPTSASRFRRASTPRALSSSPASPATPRASTPSAVAAASSPRKRNLGALSPAARTPSRSVSRTAGSPLGFMRPCGVSRSSGVGDSKDLSSPTSTPRKPLSAAMTQANAVPAGASPSTNAHAPEEAAESRLPRPNFAAFAVLRAAAAAVRGRAPGDRGKPASPRRAGAQGPPEAPEGPHGRIGSPGLRYSDTPKKPSRPSRPLNAASSKGTVSPCASTSAVAAPSAKLAASGDREARMVTSPPSSASQLAQTLQAEGTSSDGADEGPAKPREHQEEGVGQLSDPPAAQITERRSRRLSNVASAGDWKSHATGVPCSPKVAGALGGPFRRAGAVRAAASSPSGAVKRLRQCEKHM
ncbi:uncharacterized protein LOC34617879 [Cyclospora cayetanensis]|uniref:Uncharacterized protein LOC34617879 n=1 Tax=Cyclospora cayetanensis TaxID=88456 RepID=A0A6P6RUL0_9EIME|nr:uncharacterized protein LOC34617879 [Cyclospora cayetanensis]